MIKRVKRRAMKVHAVTSKHPILVTFALLSAVTTFGFWQFRLVLDDVQQTQEAQIESDIARQVDSCDAANNSRRAIQAVLKNAQRQAEADDFDGFDSVAGWDELSPETQLYLSNLNNELFTPTGSTYLGAILEEYERTNPIRDCDHVEEQARQELGLSG